MRSKLSRIIKEIKNSNKVRVVKDTSLITIGILSAGLGLKGFIIPNNFIDGGVTGISLLLSLTTGIPLPLLIIIINAPFIAMGFKQVSKIFSVKTIFSIAGLALCLVVFPFPVVTNDKLLTSVFGGMSLGAGIGFAVRGGCVIDGTEVLAIFLSKKFNAKVGDIILVINIAIFSVAAVILGIEIAFYSVLTYISATRTVDFIIEGLEEYTGVTIISDYSDDICNVIIEKLGRGVTIYSGKKGFGKRGSVDHEIEIVFTVITRLEISRLRSLIDHIDRNAFVFQHSINDIKGGMVKKRPIP